MSTTVKRTVALYVPVGWKAPEGMTTLKSRCCKSPVAEVSDVRFAMLTEEPVATARNPSVAPSVPHVTLPPAGVVLIARRRAPQREPEPESVVV